jgi:cytochrome c oxidase assembly factor CtaG
MVVDPRLIGIMSAALLYQLGRRGMTGGRRREGTWRAEAFYAGLVALLVAMEPPLDVFADKLFWAYMLQHMLLQMVAPPCSCSELRGCPVWRLLALSSRRQLAGALKRSGALSIHCARALPLGSRLGSLHRDDRTLASAPVFRLRTAQPNLP